MLDESVRISFKVLIFKIALHLETGSLDSPRASGSLDSPRASEIFFPEVPVTSKIVYLGENGQINTQESAVKNFNLILRGPERAKRAEKESEAKTKRIERAEGSTGSVLNRSQHLEDQLNKSSQLEDQLNKSSQLEDQRPLQSENQSNKPQPLENELDQPSRPNDTIVLLTRSIPSFLLIRLLQFLNLKPELVYRYSELEQIPLALHILIHLPIFLALLIMSIALWTLYIDRPAAAGHIEKYTSTCKYHKCLICIENFIEGDEIKFLNCGHSFHIQCIDAWTIQAPICPTCRDPIYLNKCLNKGDDLSFYRGL